MAAQHTPGPWTVFVCDDGGRWSGWPLSITGDDVQNGNGDGRLIVRTGGQWPYEWDNGTSKDEALANARLLSAAPDLLAALKLARAYLDHSLGSTWEGENPYPVIDAAIARAEG